MSRRQSGLLRARWPERPDGRWEREAEIGARDVGGPEKLEGMRRTFLGRCNLFLFVFNLYNSVLSVSVSVSVSVFYCSAMPSSVIMAPLQQRVEERKGREAEKKSGPGRVTVYFEKRACGARAGAVGMQVTGCTLGCHCCHCWRFIEDIDCWAKLNLQRNVACKGCSHATIKPAVQEASSNRDLYGQ